jgi:3',5'-cyclic AMP phosphodiesterase CpdA
VGLTIAPGSGLSAVTEARAVLQQPARQPGAGSVTLPNREGSLKFCVLGDFGTGDKTQYELAAQMVALHDRVKYPLVILVGDNLYGSERPQDFEKKFEIPYKPILDAGIKFYAALGNHDSPNQRVYKPFNMNGERFYTFKKGDARFFALDSNYMDQVQLKWLDEQLSRANDRWKIAFFHHPLYSSGARHGSEVDLRTRLEPLFVKYGVDIVFAGHEHFYERIVPQKGIYYFTQGGSAKLREGNIRVNSALTDKGFDTDNVFMVAELGKDSMQFQVVSRAGKRVDSGSLRLMPEPKPSDDKSRSQ